MFALFLLASEQLILILFFQVKQLIEAAIEPVLGNQAYKPKKVILVLVQLTQKSTQMGLAFAPGSRLDNNDRGGRIEKLADEQQAFQVCCHLRHHATQRGWPAYRVYVLLGYKN